MYLIDSHTHLFDEAFDADRDSVVESCIKSGVEKMVLPCCSPKSLAGISYLCGKYPGHCFPTIGLHPEDIGPDPGSQLSELFSARFACPPVAVGEIGIDLHYCADTLDTQRRVFDFQARKAVDMGLPIIIHCRDAYPEVFEILEPLRGKARGIFHCFGGSPSDAERVLGLGGFYFGIGGVVTFKNSGAALAEIVSSQIPLSSIVLETDSPYLAPSPFRGRRNDSTMLRLVASRIAELKGVALEEVASATSRNSEMIFGI